LFLPSAITLVNGEKRQVWALEANAKSQRLEHLLGSAVFYGALVLIVLAAVPYGSVESWWTSFFEVGVFAIAALWSIEAVIGSGYHFRRWGWLALPAGSLIIFSFIQTIPLGTAAVGSLDSTLRRAISADPFETRSFVFRIAALTLLGILLLRFTDRRVRLQALIHTVIGIGVATALFGILRQTMQHADMGFVLPALPRGIGYAQIISRNQFAFMMEMSLGVALGMIFRRGVRYEVSLFYLSLALPIGVALILANSRGGIITMTCQLIFLALMVVPALWTDKETRGDNPERHKRTLIVIATRALLIAVLVGVTAMAVVWVGGERVVSNLSTVSDELKPEAEPGRWNTSRMEMWGATWRMIKEHPGVGIGFGGYWIAIARYHDASGTYTPQQAHNDYLEILASGGIVGVAIWLCLIVLVLRRLRRVLLVEDSFRRAAALGALVGLVGVAIHSLFDFGLHLTIDAALCVALVAIGTADIQGRAQRVGKAEG
jgi:O-antigen ligase